MSAEPARRVRLDPATPDDHAGLLHDWGHQPHATPWWQLDRTLDEVSAYLARQVASAHLDAWIASVDGEPLAYVETYRAADDPLAGHYDARPGDRGWHILVGPPGELGSGRPRLVARAVLASLFADPDVERVVCEPDVANARMLAFCARLGHEQVAELDLPDKRAALLVCTRASFAAGTSGPDPRTSPTADPVAPVRRGGGRSPGFDHDLVGVGLGPFNLGLAALLAPVPDVDAAFFEQRASFRWHQGLLLDGTTLQVPFLADLVTLADPTSPYSFLNYLHQRGRLLRFYLYERFHVPRREFDAYCRWVADQLPSCRFGTRVSAVEALDPDDARSGWSIEITAADGSVERRTSRCVALGVGTTPAVPACARALLGERVWHTAAYLDHRDELLAAPEVAVVGSGQSAAEVVADLLRHLPDGHRLTWGTRSRGFLAMEYSKLGLEHFSPDHAAWFHGLPEGRRDEVRAGQDLLYKGISAETSAEIYDLLYERSVDGHDVPLRYASGCELVSVEVSRSGGRRLRLGLRQRDDGTCAALEVDALVLGTGYDQAPLPLGPEARRLLAEDGRGRPVVSLDHRLVDRDGHPTDLFVQNAELHTHGVGSPDLGLGAHRSAVIANAVAGRELYPATNRQVFQSFGVPAGVAPDAAVEGLAP